MKKYPKCDNCGKGSVALTNGWCDECACLKFGGAPPPTSADVIPDGFDLMDVKGSILKLEPQDILVIQAKGSVTAETCGRLKELVEGRYGIKCLVLGDDLQLKVLRPAADAAASTSTSQCAAKECNTPSQDRNIYCAFHFKEILDTRETWRKRYAREDADWPSILRHVLVAVVIFVVVGLAGIGISAIT